MTEQFVQNAPMGGTIVALTIALIKSMKGSGKKVTKDVCPIHATVESKLREGDRRMSELCQTAEKTNKLVVAIAAHMGLIHKDIEVELKDLFEK